MPGLAAGEDQPHTHPESPPLSQPQLGVSVVLGKEETSSCGQGGIAGMFDPMERSSNLPGELLQQRRRSALSTSLDAPLGGPSVSSASQSRHVWYISGPGVPRGPQSDWVSGHGVLALASLRVDSSLAGMSPPPPGADSVSWQVPLTAPGQAQISGRSRSPCTCIYCVAICPTIKGLKQQQSFSRSLLWS